MKVLLINGSPNEKGCTYTALSEVAKSLNEQGVETEIMHVGHLDIRGCMGCRKCKEGSGKCVFNDVVNEVAQKLPEIDGMVVGSPVFFASPNGSVVSFLDRLFFSTQTSCNKAMKVGAAVVSARRGGCTASLDMLDKYFAISGMPIATSQYWNMVHGNTPDEVRQDAEGMQTLRILAKNMAFLIKSIKLGKQEYGVPEPEARIFTNFVR